MFKFKKLEIDAYIHSTDISGLEYNILKREFEEFWYAQSENKNEVFITKPCPFFPFSDVVLISRGFYDIAHIPSTSNCFFTSQKMLDIFDQLSMPKFQVWPIQYSVRKKLYSGYWLAFTYDYARDIDYQNSKFLIKYNKKENFREETIVFQNVEKYIQFLHYHYGMLPSRAEFSAMYNEFYIDIHNLSGVPLSIDDQIHQEFKKFLLERFPKTNDMSIDSIYPLKIKFLPHVYELDIIPLFHFTREILISQKATELFKINKVPKIDFFDEPRANYCTYI